VNEKYPIVEFMGIRFNLANDLSGIVAAVLVFALVFWLSRKPQFRPTKKQNILEWLIDFTDGIVHSAIPGEAAQPFRLFAFVLFLFIWMSNQLGLAIEVNVGGTTWIKSPTSDPMVTMSLAFMALVLTHYFSVRKFGFGGYLHNYLRPMALLLPINLLEEFTNFLTLALRLYGNIFAGEILLTLLGSVMKSFGIVSIVLAAPLELIWQGFSVFIGSIQAYVFVTLAMVYMSRKLETE
jgi:F-type H+-transporting ATPase subunit a